MGQKGGQTQQSCARQPVETAGQRGFWEREVYHLLKGIVLPTIFLGGGTLAR